MTRPFAKWAPTAVGRTQVDGHWLPHGRCVTLPSAEGAVSFHFQLATDLRKLPALTAGRDRPNLPPSEALILLRDSIRSPRMPIIAVDTASPAVSSENIRRREASFP